MQLCTICAILHYLYNALVVVTILLQSTPTIVAIIHSWPLFCSLSSVLTFRIIFALGGSAAADMLTAVVADYAREGRRSQLSGLMGFCTGLGACFGAFVLTRLPGRVGLDCAYWTAAGLLLAGAGCIAWKVRPAPLSLAEPGATATAHERCWWRRMLLGFGLLGKHPLLLVAYAGGFVARGDTVVLPVFLPGWLSYRTGRVDDRLVSSISGTCHLAALLGAPVAGLLGDRLGRTRVLLVCALTSALAYTCMPFLSSPLSLWSFLCIALQGFAQIGTIITSMSLLAAEAPADSRGAVAGVYSLCGAAGIVAVGRGGAALGGTLNGGGPFLFMAGVNAVLAVLTLTASIRGQGSRK